MPGARDPSPLIDRAKPDVKHTVRLRRPELAAYKLAMALRDPSLAELDPEIAQLIASENRREHESLRLIASENYASRAVMEATGSCLTNKYSEGYPHKRYYEGQAVVDQVEELAKARVGKLFATSAGIDVADLHVNV